MKSNLEKENQLDISFESKFSDPNKRRAFYWVLKLDFSFLDKYFKSFHYGYFINSHDFFSGLSSLRACTSITQTCCHGEKAELRSFWYVLQFFLTICPINLVRFSLYLFLFDWKINLKYYRSTKKRMEASTWQCWNANSFVTPKRTSKWLAHCVLLPTSPDSSMMTWYIFYWIARSLCNIWSTVIPVDNDHPCNHEIVAVFDRESFFRGCVCFENETPKCWPLLTHSRGGR